MKLNGWLARLVGVVFGLAALASPVRADTVRLKNGGQLENVKVEPEGRNVRIVLEHGSIVLPAADVLEVVPAPTRTEQLAAARDELARRKLAAGDDPARIRAVAAWASEQKLTDESDQLLAVARGIELDRKLATLQGTRDPNAYLALYRSLGSQYSEGERSFILERALALDPDNAEVRRELGQVRRGGHWVTLADAARMDAEAEEQLMRARGYVRYEGRWMTPDAVAAAEAQKELARERQAADEAAARAAADKAQADAEIARLQQERADADAETARLEAERRELEAEQAANQPTLVVGPYGSTYGVGPYGSTYGYPYGCGYTPAPAAVVVVHHRSWDDDGHRHRIDWSRFQQPCRPGYNAPAPRIIVNARAVPGSSTPRSTAPSASTGYTTSPFGRH